MIKCNGRNNDSKWAVRFRAIIDNTLAIEHKYRHSLSIKIGNNYKREEQKKKKYTQILSQKPLWVNFFLNNFLLF